jgi:hypothetical protein
MKKIDLGQSVSIIANIGVVAGILLLAYELNQNRELAVAQFNLEQDSLRFSAELPMLSDDLAAIWERSIYDSASLSAAELKELDSYYAMQVGRWEIIWGLEQQGLNEAGSTRTSLEYAAKFYFGNSLAHTWWSFDRVNWPEDFAELVDEALANLDQTENREWIDALTESVAESESN